MRFLVESWLTEPLTPDILALFPAESARGWELDRLGVREALYVASNNTRAWQVLRAESQTALDELLASFPLAPYVTHRVIEIAEPQQAP